MGASLGLSVALGNIDAAGHSTIIDILGAWTSKGVSMFYELRPRCEV